MDEFGPGWEELVVRAAEQLSCAIPRDRVRLLARHARLVREVGRGLNLTTITDPAAFAEKHVVDSLALIPFIPGEVRALFDLGSGAGFPGLVLAIARPELAVTLVESRAKKAAFLTLAVSELGLANVSVENGRAEDLLKEARPDAVAARAVASLWDLFRLVKGYLAAGGQLLAMKGPDPAAEVEELLKRAGKKGLSPRVSLSSYRLPTAGARTLVRVRLAP